MMASTGGLDGAGVGDLLEAAPFHDIDGIAALAPDDLEHVLGDLAGNRTGRRSGSMMAPSCGAGDRAGGNRRGLPY